MGEDAGSGCPRTPEERLELHGRCALITGGSRGLGRAIAFGLAAAGADVAIASRRIQMGREVATEIVYAAFGKLDVLVNNAEKSPLYSSVEEIDEGYWDGVLGLNLKGPFRLAALVGSRMAAGEGGSIINVSSVAARHPRPDSAPYSAAKAGLEAITVALAHGSDPGFTGGVDDIDQFVRGSLATKTVSTTSTGERRFCAQPEMPSGSACSRWSRTPSSRPRRPCS